MLMLIGIQSTFANDTTAPIAKSDLVFKEAGGVVAVEAEHFVSQDKAAIRAWHRFQKSGAPDIQPDPDEAHVAGASNGCYLEALPDTRTTHDDKLVRGENFFAKPGLAGILTYNIEFTNPGRYYVWVRHFSTGSEDNGIHVGLNGKWPESGRRWQTIKKKKWAWESRQRTKEVHVGIKFKLYLDIEKAGRHQVHFSIREDGFEFDKFVLSSDKDFEPQGIGPEPVVAQGSLPTADAEHAGKDSDSKRLPDIVVYLADDLSTADLPLYGGTNIKTPSIDKLAADGMVFNRAFVASPSCAVSRAALLTGLMPAKNGAEENHSYPRPQVLKLPKILNDLGYQTAAFGKVAHQKSAPDYHFHIHDSQQHIPQLRETVKEFLENRTDKRPLALFVGVSDPHVPWPSESTIDPESMEMPPQLLDTPRTRVQRSRYLQEVKNLDAYLGELRELTDKHLSKDQLFVFSSDHGAQFPFGKWTLYDEGIHVPLIVAHSGKIKAGTRTDAMVSWVDILPTLIDAANGDVPDGLDGRSFQSVLHGKTDSHRDQIFTTHSGDRLMNVYLSRSVRTDRYKFIWNPHPEFAFTTHIEMLLRETSGDYFKQWTELAKSDSRAAAIVDRHHGRPEFELFDLKNDPEELSNLSDDPKLAKVKDKLFGELKDWIKSQDDELTVFHEPLMLDAPETWVPRKRKRK